MALIVDGINRDSSRKALKPGGGFLNLFHQLFPLHVKKLKGGRTLGSSALETQEDGRRHHFAAPQCGNQNLGSKQQLHVKLRFLNRPGWHPSALSTQGRGLLRLEFLPAGEATASSHKRRQC
ncbi:hypothetical protein Q2941_47420 [Bradyrhizobium sp. UFLA05-153]